MRQGSPCNRCGHFPAPECPVAVNYAFPEWGFFLCGLIYALYPCKALTAFVGQENLLFKHAGEPQNAGVFNDGGKKRAVRDKKFPGGRPYHKIWVRRLQGLSNQAVEAVENGKDYNQRCRSNCHTCHANSGNHVDHVMAFPGK